MDLPTLASCLLAFACAASPAMTAQQAGRAGETRAAAGAFPTPKEGLKLTVTADGGPTIEQLVAEYERVTGLHVVASPETRSIMRQSRTGLARDLDVPASRVYEVVESIFAANSYALTQLTREEPRMLAIHSLNTNERNTIRSKSLLIPVAEVEAYARHPALLVHTAVDLPLIDVRTLSNSLRTLLTDTHTEALIPLGNSNQLVVGGYASFVAETVRMLQVAHEAEQRNLDARRAEQAQREQPPQRPERTPAEGAQVPR
jgi:hypothetical protein